MPAVLSYSYLVSFLLTREVLGHGDSSYLKTLFNLSISHVDNLHQQIDYGNTGFRADCIGKIFSLVIVGLLIQGQEITLVRAHESMRKLPFSDLMQKCWSIIT